MIVKSIISVFTAGVILFSSAFTPVAKAGLVEDLANSYMQSNFAGFVMGNAFTIAGTGVGAYYGSPQVGAIIGSAVGAGFNDLVAWYAAGHTDDEVYDAFAQHADDLQTDLGTATLINGGIRLYPLVTEAGNLPSGGKANTYYYGGSYPAEYPVTCVMTWPVLSHDGEYPWFKAGSVKVPFNCLATSGYTYSGGASYYRSDGLTQSKSVAQGKSVSFSSGTAYHVQFNAKAGSVGMTFTPYIDLVPTADPLSSFTTQDITVNSRPTFITGDYGIIGDDGTIIHIEGNKIVNEDDSTVYNPVTDTTYDFTDYAFDYSDRSYLLTLEDGNTIKVVYGDENITIEEGDTIYNIYYLIPNIPGGDDPGSGDDPGDIPGGEDWSWWRKAWQEFTDKLFGILGNGSTVNPDNAPSVPDDEESGDKGYTIIDLFVVLKDGTWAFITGIVGTAFDGFTSFVDAVASAGGFFTFFDEESQEGILFIPLEDGETIWD